MKGKISARLAAVLNDPSARAQLQKQLLDSRPGLIHAQDGRAYELQIDVRAPEAQVKGEKD